VLPGITQPDRFVLVTAHYDSIGWVRKPYTGEEQIIAEAVRQGTDAAEERIYLKLVPPDVESGPLDYEATAATAIAPGVTDDGSGTAVVMELARVMSQHRFDKTLVFIAFSAEEMGGGGSQAWAEMARQKSMQIGSGTQ
jgi:putative aminopeptidase FrvX